jgi:response regulator NasT
MIRPGGENIVTAATEGGVRVLLADDAGIVRRVMAGMLESAGHVVVGEAGNGDDAVRLFAELRPDVAVIDVNMPDLDGISAAEAIRSVHPAAPIVLMSVYVNEERLRRVHALGKVAYVMKPVDAHSFVEAVERAASVHA